MKACTLVDCSCIGGVVRGPNLNKGQNHNSGHEIKQVALPSTVGSRIPPLSSPQDGAPSPKFQKAPHHCDGERKEEQWVGESDGHVVDVFDTFGLDISIGAGPALHPVDQNRSVALGNAGWTVTWFLKH